MLNSVMRRCLKIGVASEQSDDYLPMGYLEFIQPVFYDGQRHRYMEQLTLYFGFGNPDRIVVRYISTSLPPLIHLSHVSGTKSLYGLDFEFDDVDAFERYICNMIYTIQDHHKAITTSTLTSVLCFQRLGILKDVAVLLGKYVYRLKWEWFKK